MTICTLSALKYCLKTNLFYLSKLDIMSFLLVFIYFEDDTISKTIFGLYPHSAYSSTHKSLTRRAFSNFFRPVFANNFRLFQNKLSGASLFVRRITVFPKNTLDDHSHLGANIFSNSPVNGDTVPYGPRQF
jgi:hypothetical protein